MFHVYVIKCAEGRYYIGSTEDVVERLRQHNARAFKAWTNRYTDWVLVYTEQLPSRTEALKRERQIKSMKGGRRFKQLIGAIKPDR
jgi:predicted GIY-YIG superfamily endonuclease